MNFDVKGHSGCQIDIINENGNLFVVKSTKDPRYLERLLLQANKQAAASIIEYQHIRVPKILNIEQTPKCVSLRMPYIYSRNFVEFFEDAGFEQIDYFIQAIVNFIELEISQCRIQDVQQSIFLKKLENIKSELFINKVFEDDNDVLHIVEQSTKIFEHLGVMKIPVGVCHGDFTFSNILFNGNNYYLIDFLDSFIETPLQDIVKLRQDTCFLWSQMMYKKHFDFVRLRIICEKIDQEINTYFENKYQWYTANYNVLQLMNILRILPYAHEKRIIERLIEILKKILYE